MIPVEETALHKHCMMAYSQWKASNTHHFNEELNVLLQETIKALNFMVIDMADGYKSVSFLIKDDTEG